MDDRFQLSLLKGSLGKAFCRSFFYIFHPSSLKKPHSSLEVSVTLDEPHHTEAKHKIRKSQSISTKMLKVPNKEDNRKPLSSGITQCAHR